jgi:hypothetical protein
MRETYTIRVNVMEFSIKSVGWIVITMFQVFFFFGGGGGGSESDLRQGTCDPKLVHTEIFVDTSSFRVASGVLIPLWKQKRIW